MSTVIESPVIQELKFSEVGAQLASAETIAKAKGADATAARAQKSSLATAAIHAAVNEKISAEDVKNDLQFAGVLKGTVSKIVTVINAVNNGVLTLADVTSMSAAYTLATSPRDASGAIVAKGPKVKVVTETKIKEVSVPAKYTKKGAIDFLIALIDEGSVDEALRQASDIVGKITRGISKATKAREDGEAAAAEGE